MYPPGVDRVRMCRLFCLRQIFRCKKFNDIFHSCLIIVLRDGRLIPVGVIALEPTLQIVRFLRIAKFQMISKAQK